MNRDQLMAAGIMWRATQQDLMDEGEHRHSFRTGSGIILGYDVANDYDVLLLVRDLDYTNALLYKWGWSNCFHDWEAKTIKDQGSLSDDGYTVEIAGGAKFAAWRKLDCNLIVTDDPSLHLRTVAATIVARRVNEMHPGSMDTKAQRIELFRAIKFGEDYSGEMP